MRAMTATFAAAEASRKLPLASIGLSPAPYENAEPSPACNSHLPRVGAIVSRY